MEKTKLRKPTPGKFSLLRQLCNLIPSHLIPSHLVAKLARDTGVPSGPARSHRGAHVVSLISAQFTQPAGASSI